MLCRRFLLLCAAVAMLAGACRATVTPLTEYVWREDGAFKWEYVPSATLRFSNYTVHQVFLTSQTWLTPEDSSAYLWTHWIQLCVPDDIYPDADNAILWIDGGRSANINNPPGSFDDITSRMCTGSHLMTAYLSAIPNSPVIFADDPSKKSRTEDAIIAWTWLHYVQDTMEPDWLARLPMTKASIKAIDAIQEFVAQHLTTLRVPQRFVTAGGSKRGWTSWMTGCVNDPRVVGVIPVVAPIPELVPQMNEQWQSLGTYSWALVDYVDVGLMPGYLNTPVFEQLLHIVDPLTYQDEMAATPKLVIVAWCDEFFQPDSAQYYWSALPGKKYLRVVPNADHPLVGSLNNVVDASLPFIMSFVDETLALPDYAWQIDGNTITVTASAANFVEARAWYSRATYRDWRLVRCPQATCANPQAFASSVVIGVNATVGDTLVFSHTQERPNGRPYRFAAHLIELTYNLGSAAQPLLFKITSDLSIISESAAQPYPYPPCPADVCACGPDCEPIDLILA